MQTTAPARNGATRKYSGPWPVSSARLDPTLLRRLSLRELPGGEGRTHAPIVWLFLCSHMRGSGRTVVWPSNDRIARCTALSLRAVERGIAYLRAIGKITITHAMRPARAKPRKPGRLIELHLIGDGPVPVVRFPSPQMMARITRSCAAVRSRPAALVAVALAELVLAGAEQGSEVTEATHVTAPISMVRSLVGAPHSSTFNRRLADLERAGLLARVGTHWRSGAVVKLPQQAAPRPIPKLLSAPMLRVSAQPPAANDGPTLEEVVALEAEMAAALGWRARSSASQSCRTGTAQPQSLLRG
jgi:hypothetical protein